MTIPTGATPSSLAPTKSARERLRIDERPHALHAAFFSFWIGCSILYCSALFLSIRGTSLWTDEAFSAWEASHRTFGGLIHALFTGDSSDLQVGFYHSYLFGWVQIVGHSEYALRAANMPFALIFSLAIVYTSVAILKSRWAWIPAGMLPFIWQFTSEVRGYMASLAFSAASVALLISFLRARNAPEARRRVWLLLGCLLLGSMFHMLFLLAVPPLLVLTVLLSRRHTGILWREWRWPAVTFALPFIALAAFLAWTFTRASILYDYPAPGLRQMSSVAYEIAGFGGFGPNRKYSLDFRSHLVPVAIGGGALLLGFGFALAGWLRRRRDPLFASLAAALAVGCVETLALAFGTHKQPDSRHLAALVPFFLFLLMSIMGRCGRTGLVAAALLGCGWLASDIRTATITEYQKEDFRGAAAAAIEIHNREGADIAIASDPAGAAYYGIRAHGDWPCIPFDEDCATAMSGETWKYTADGEYTARWDRSQADRWLASRQHAVVAIIPLDRARTDSVWISILAQHPEAPRIHLHAFEVVLFRPHKGTEH